MAGPARKLDARALVQRVELGDRGAAYELARRLRPDTIDEFVGFVCPDAPPRPDLFDVLADNFAAWQQDTSQP